MERGTGGRGIFSVPTCSTHVCERGGKRVKRSAYSLSLSPLFAIIVVLYLQFARKARFDYSRDMMIRGMRARMRLIVVPLAF